MKKVLVTGAGGFVGARIMEQWRGRYELLRLPSGFFARTGEAELCAQVEVLAPDIILHAAALSDTGFCETHPEESFRANVELPLWLARAARRVGAKLICFSSDQVYTGIRQSGPLPEALPLEPANIYGRHKLEAEQRVLALLPEAVFLRATWMYDLPGYGLPIRGNLPLNILQAALHGRPLAFSEKDFRGVTYVRQAIEQLALTLDLPGGVYNFGSENPLDMAATARIFARALEVPLVLVPLDRQRNLAMDCSLLRKKGISFDTTAEGICRCLRDYGLR